MVGAKELEESESTFHHPTLSVMPFGRGGRTLLTADGYFSITYGQEGLAVGRVFHKGTRFETCVVKMSRTHTRALPAMQLRFAGRLPAYDDHDGPTGKGAIR